MTHFLFCHSPASAGTHTLSPGSVVIAAVRKVNPHVGLSLKLPFAGKGTASMLDLSDRYTANSLQQYHEGQLVRWVPTQYGGVKGQCDFDHVKVCVYITLAYLHN